MPNDEIQGAAATNRDVPQGKPKPIRDCANSRRRFFCAGLSLFLISACEAKPTTITLDVVLFSYLDRPIFDVFVGKREVGVAGPYPYSGKGTMMGIDFPIGPQKVSWTLGGPENMARNGEIVTAKNAPKLNEIQGNVRYLSVHVYPDDTVEFLFTEHFPGLSPRGEKIDTEWRKRHQE